MGAPGPRRGAGGPAVARPSLKRVVPGSVPPWRALCAASARALKAFFSILCISCEFLNRRTASWGRRCSWAACSPMKGASEHFHFLSVLAGGHGPVPPARACFVAPDPGCRAMFFVAAPWFSTSGNQKSGGRSCSLGRLTEHFRDRNALGFARRRTSKLVGRAAQTRT